MALDSSAGRRILLQAAWVLCCTQAELPAGSVTVMQYEVWQGLHAGI